MKKNIFYGMALFIYLFSVGCHPTSKFVSLKYEYPKISERLKSGATSFIFQFYNPKMDKSRSHFKIISYPIYNSPPENYRPDTLEIAKDSAKSFIGEVILGNNTISRKSIESTITDDNNNPINYKYILFVPTLINNHVAYTLYAITNKDSAALFKKAPSQTEPCPPAICLQ